MLDPHAAASPDRQPQNAPGLGPDRRRALVAAGLIGLLLLLRLADVAVIQSARIATFDMWQQVWPRSPATVPVTIVDIDEASLAAIGQWPWPRDRLAALVEALADRGVRAVAFAMVFAEPDRLSPPRIAARFAPHDAATAGALTFLPDHDRIFAEALDAVPAVLGLSVGNRPGAGDPPLPGRVAILGADPAPGMPHYPGLVRNISALQEAADGQGVLLFTPERDGVVRRLPLMSVVDGRLYPNLALETARVARGLESYLLRSAGSAGGLAMVSLGGLDIPTNTDGSVWLHFAPRDRMRGVSAASLLEDGGAVPDLSGRIVLVGSSAAGLGDYVRSPLGEPLPSVEVLAQSVSAILDNGFLTRPLTMPVVEIIAATFWAGVLVLIGLRVSGKVVLGATFVLCLGFVGISLLFFVAQGSLFDPSFPTLMLAATGTYLLYAAYRREEVWRREQEIAYHEYNALMRQVAENLFDGVMVVDTEGRVRACNNAGLKMLRLEERRLLGSRFLDWARLPDAGDEQGGSGGTGDGEAAEAMTSAGTPAGDCARLSALVGGSSPRAARLTRRDGSVLDADLAVTAIEPYGLECFVVVLRDVTEKKRAERQVETVSNRLRQAIGNVDQAFALWDPDGRLAAFNAQFRYLFRPCAEAIVPGLEAGAWVALVSDLLAEPERSARAHDIGAAFAGGGALEIEVAEGHWILATFKKTDDVGTVALFTDISDLKLREIALIEANQRIERQAQDLTRLADELEAARRKAEEDGRRAEEARRGQADFLAIMSHEIRTPLNAIIGFSEALAQGYIGPIDPMRYADAMDAIHRSARILETKVNAVMRLSGVDGDGPEAAPVRLDIAAVVRERLGLLEPWITERRLTVRTTLAPDLPPVLADRGLMDRIVGTLLSHAVNATAPEGTITIEAGYEAGRGLTLRVTDGGVGLEPGLAYALTPFGRIRRRRRNGSAGGDTAPTPRSTEAATAMPRTDQPGNDAEGARSHLATVARAAESLGGQVELTTRPGIGATVNLLLPDTRIALG
ncbi:MAG: CHASE2 domain-containing protein [Alphaproteobacteria bacterium]|jgi:CHASE2 domain-containing sensor protein/signal transduction histidine kinase|nr:CHASE2 domain-containing protein [Alphaproteobacteria bacterium]